MYKYRQRNEDCQKEVCSFVLVSFSSKSLSLNFNDQCNSVPTLLTRFFKSTNVPEND